MCSFIIKQGLVGRMGWLSLDMLVTRVPHTHPSASAGKAVYQNSVIMSA